MQHKTTLSALALRGLVLLFAFLAAIPAIAQSAAAPAKASQSQARSGQDEVRHAQLFARALEHGPIPVIVELRTDLQPEAALPSTFAVQSQRARLATTQQRVLDRLAIFPRAEAAFGIKRFNLFRGFSMLADEEDILDLLDDPDVLRLIEDEPMPAVLAQSVPLIGADATGTYSGATGLGQAIAVLDTGVDKFHPFLIDKVVSEACYSSNVPAHGATSLCPGGITASTAIHSGLDCSASTYGCGHGTHVAGIAAGQGNGFSGVAREGDIIAIQVFSQFTGSTCTDNGMTSPCILSYVSDQIRGLERVFNLRSTHDIASVNMSLGGGLYPGTCDSQPQKPAIDNLRAAGIPTIVASGNGGHTSGIASPACISSAISVGSTTKLDAVSWFSNSSGVLDLLAPGQSIQSSVLGDTYGFRSGTSNAAPHVAGAWAVLREARPDAGIDEILAELKATGAPVTDTRSGANARVTPRIRVIAALDALIGNDVEPVRPTSIENGESLSRLSGNQSSESRFTITVPTGATNLRIETSGGTGDVDLYVRFNDQATLSEYACRPWLNGNDEQCSFPQPSAGTYHILLYGWNSYSGVTLTASYAVEMPCAQQSILINGTAAGTQDVVACRTITTGAAGFTVTSTGQVQFRAGQRVTLAPGFRIFAGGRFRVDIEQSLAD